MAPVSFQQVPLWGFVELGRLTKNLSDSSLTTSHPKLLRYSRAIQRFSPLSIQREWSCDSWSGFWKSNVFENSISWDNSANPMALTLSNCDHIPDSSYITIWPPWPRDSKRSLPSAVFAYLAFPSFDQLAFSILNMKWRPPLCEYW